MKAATLKHRLSKLDAISNFGLRVSVTSTTFFSIDSFSSLTVPVCAGGISDLKKIASTESVIPENNKTILKTIIDKPKVKLRDVADIPKITKSSVFTILDENLATLVFK